MIHSTPYYLQGSNSDYNILVFKWYEGTFLNFCMFAYDGHNIIFAKTFHICDLISNSVHNVLMTKTV